MRGEKKRVELRKKMNPYVLTKTFLHGLNDSMHNQIKRHGTDV